MKYDCDSNAGGGGGGGGSGGGGGGGGGDGTGRGGGVGSVVVVGGSRRTRGGGGCGGTHSQYLCPLLHAVADALYGSDRGPGVARVPYAALRDAFVGAGFMWDELVAAYVRDFRARNVRLADFAFNPKGHARARSQEVLLFPSSYAPHGCSCIPEEAFTHLQMFISQAACKVAMDPSREGRAAAAAALAAFLA